MVYLRPDKASISIDSLHPLSWLVFVVLAAGTLSLSLYTFIPGSVYPHSLLQAEERGHRGQPICGNSKTGVQSPPSTDCLTDKLLSQGVQQNETFERTGKLFVIPSFDVLPVYRAECFLPAHFGRNQELYAHQACTQAMNNAVQGRGLNSPAASILFESKWQWPPSERDEKAEKFEKLVTDIIGSQVYKNRDGILHEYRDITTRLTATLLFGYGVLSLIPSFLWRIVTSSVCRLNIDKTLDLLRVSQSLGFDSRQKLYTNIARETFDAAGNTSTELPAGMFLACKLLCCLISVGEMMYTGVWVMPQVSLLSSNIAKLSSLAKATFLNEFSTSFCNFLTYDSFDVEERTVECVFHQINTNGLTDGLARLATAQNSIAVHTTIFHVILAFLVLHSLINILGTVSCGKILVCCKTENGSARNSKAVRLLLCSIDTHLGCVARREMDKVFKETERKQ